MTQPVKTSAWVAVSTAACGSAPRVPRASGLRWVRAWCALVGLALGCQLGPVTHHGAVESEAVAPPGVLCLRFAIEPDATYVNVVAGQRVTMRLDTAELGRVSFVVQGFDVGCSDLGLDPQPTFTSGPVTIEVREDETTRVNPPLHAVVRSAKGDAQPPRRVPTRPAPWSAAPQVCLRSRPLHGA
jgi:hypothetical protein